MFQHKTTLLSVEGRAGLIVARELNSAKVFLLTYESYMPT